MPARWPRWNSSSMNAITRAWNISGASNPSSARLRICTNALKQSLVTSLTRSIATNLRLGLGRALRHTHQRDLGLARIERRRQVDRHRALGGDLPPVLIVGGEHEVDLARPHRYLRRRSVGDGERHARDRRAHDLVDRL